MPDVFVAFLGKYFLSVQPGTLKYFFKTADVMTGVSQQSKMSHKIR